MSTLDRRAAGLLVPMFSLRTGREWGVGEYADLGPFAQWAKRGGFSLIMTLPLLEPSPGESSPYSSCSFFALDPLYLRMEDVPGFEGSALTPQEEAALRAVRGSPRVRHGEVRALKESVLRRVFASIDGRTRNDLLSDFRKTHREWLPGYALFRALKHRYRTSWRDWPQGLADALPEALERARTEHADEIEFREWLQWLSFEQLGAARRDMRRMGVALGGDEPFLVADDSADVWSERESYRFDATVGAPPDPFSAEGQDWGLPPYRWDRIAQSGYRLFERRGAHSARLYDVVRIDHLVGLYRTYQRPRDGKRPFFEPEREPEQLAQGEAVLRALGSGGSELIAEDLGVIPEFVRTSLDSHRIPGFRVLRWEQEHGRFRNPLEWPAASVATTGTHDTETSLEWWNALPDWERQAIRRLPELARLPADQTARFTEAVHDALLRIVYRSGSNLALIPVQDLLGLPDRINTPNTVASENWSFRMPWTVEAMEQDAILIARTEQARELAHETKRI